MADAKGKKIIKSKRAKFRSGLERKISRSLKLKRVNFKYEEDKITYVVPAKTRTYNPDFSVITKTGKTVFIEAKGIWDAEDRRKHLLIKWSNPELDIRFVFSNLNTKVAKGSSTTYRDICEGRGRGEFKGVTWQYAEKKIPQEWLDE